MSSLWAFEPAVDEYQGPGHWASASQNLPFTFQLMLIPNSTALVKVACVHKQLAQGGYMESTFQPWSSSLTKHVTDNPNCCNASNIYLKSFCWIVITLFVLLSKHPFVLVP